MTVLEGLRCVADELEKIPVAGTEQRERINNCTKLLRMMMESIEKKGEQADGDGDDSEIQRTAEGNTGSV